MATPAQFGNKSVMGTPTVSTPNTGAGGPMQPQQKKPASSGQFTNVSQYLQANKGAGQQIAGAVTNRIGTDVEKAKAETSDVANVRQAVEAEKNRISAAADATTGLKTQLQADPTKLTADETSKQNFINLRKGINQFGTQAGQAQTEGAQAASALQNAAQRVGNLNTETGRSALLGQTFANPTYSQGQKKLDQLLFQVGGAGQVKDASRNLGQAVKQQQGNYDSSLNLLNQFLTEGKKTAGDLATDLNTELVSQDAKLRSDLDTKANAMAQDRLAKNSALETFFSTGVESLTPEQREFVSKELKNAGLGFDSRTYDVLNDPAAIAKFKQAGNVKLSGKDVIDEKSLARYNALADLAELEKRQYAEVGNAGPEAAINSAALKSSIDDARAKLLSDFQNTNLTGEGLFTKYKVGGSPFVTGTTGREDFRYNATANALDLLKQLEAGGPITTSARYTNSAGQTFNPVTLEIDKQLGGSRASGIDAAEAADEASYNLFQDFLRRLDERGYNNTLGKQTASNKNYGVK
jgi:hypothetical protein